jgi:hypothetical protein
MWFIIEYEVVKPYIHPNSSVLSHTKHIIYECCKTVAKL